MLENNFNELDNDFVTLWSKYLVTGNLNLEVLTKLAELGQVNAIQSYYLLEDDEAFPNHVIEKNCKNLPNDYNGRYAKLNRIFRIKSNNPKAATMFLSGGYGEMAKAITLAKIDYEEKENALSGERYLEMLYSMTASNLDEESLFDLSMLAKEVRDRIESGYERYGEPQYAFALGKNMLFFGEDKQMQDNAKLLLGELANREYSKKLNNHKTELEKITEFVDENGGYHIF